MVRRAVVVMLAAWCARAQAGGLVIGGGSPRAIGRAGAGTVGDDGGGALLVDPAAMARRDSTRIQLAGALVERGTSWQSAAPGAPDARDQQGPSYLPLVAAVVAVHGWLVGAAAMTSYVDERALPSPATQDPAQLASAYDYRYAGIAGALRRDTVTVGVARRVGDSLAFGIAVAGSRVALSESRAVWAGFSGREAIGDASHDVDVAIAASDDLEPSVIAGVLVAPPDTRLELAASAGWRRAARLSGQVAASGPTLGNGPPGVQVTSSSPAARLALTEPVELHGGARWLGDRWEAELDGNLWLLPPSARAPVWQIAGVQVVDVATRDSKPLAALPSRASQITHGDVRAAVDVEVISGFLWATAGYAYATASTDAAHLSPTFGDLGGHTVALGLEASSGGFTVALGWSHTWAPSTEVDASAWRLDNPFRAGDGPVLPGRYSGGIDLIGVAVDADLGGAP